MRAEQGVWHQWQRQTGNVRVGAGWPASGVLGMDGVDALLAVMVRHGWAVGAGDGMAVSTASEIGNGEP